MRRLILCWAALAALIASPSHAAEPLRAVASFSIIGDMASRVGGEFVAVTTLVGPGGDVHVYEPTPNDARQVAAADLVFVNGLGLEGWLPRLIDAARPHARIVTLTDGIDLLQAPVGGAPDPHGWQSPTAAKRYIVNITSALVSADPAHADAFRRAAAAYLAELDALDGQIRQDLADLPAAQRRVITTHNAFRYFGRDYGVEFVAPVGLANDSEPSAGAIAQLIRQIRREHIKALFLENVSDRRLIDELAREANATVGPTLYPDALSRQDGPAPTYLLLIRHNAEALAASMRRNLAKD
jgi:zinc/manganese transport system substrate-binding protein